ncbi:hypothetical protein [Mycobacteroides abscessus]|uniref:hypothetical protein n=1 Tax=Mycobacteroides abscessus TaxID=36809 RepID=UPI000A5BE32A|nr:hypothetical protein [Mycobacteroides abscessus]
MLNTTFIRRTRFTAAALIGAAALAITASPTALAGPTGTPNALDVTPRQVVNGVVSGSR